MIRQIIKQRRIRKCFALALTVAIGQFSFGPAHARPYPWSHESGSRSPLITAGTGFWAVDGFYKKSKKKNRKLAARKRIRRPASAPVPIAEIVPRCDLASGRIDISSYSSVPLISQSGVLEAGLIKPLDTNDQPVATFADPRDLQIAQALAEIFKPSAMGLYAPYLRVRQGRSAPVSTITVETSHLSIHKVISAYDAIRKHYGKKARVALISECSELRSAEGN